MTKFDPDSVVGVLRDGLFHHYVHMCLGIETAPQTLASFGEQCPCHSALEGHMNSYQKDLMLTEHYGEGVTRCPAAGMMGPELVAGSVSKKSFA